MVETPASYLMHDPPIAFAHRGGAAMPENRGIENSIAAFEHAYSLGYRYFETDVRASRDGVVYACHDENFTRLTGGPGRIADLLSGEIDEFLLGDREPLVRFDALLKHFGDVNVNIDVKSDDVVGGTLRVIDELGAADRVCLASFSHRRLMRIRTLAPRLLTASSSREAALMRFHGRVPQAPKYYQVPVRHRGIRVVTPSFVSRAHAAGQQVHVWTVDDPDEMHELLDLGVDGIMTDRTDLLKDVLVQRGQWKEPA